jgi:signal transduction histidine kinase
MGDALSGSAEILWWTFAASVIAVVVLVVALGIAVVISQRQVGLLHQDYAGRLLRLHEEEHSRVAREVHDDVIQRVAILEHELDMFTRTTPGLGGDAVHRLQGIRNEARDLAEALRQVAHRLHPATIEHAGLPAALTQLAEETARWHRVDVQLSLPEAPLSLPPDVSLALFRIAQEALRNVVRHARAASAILTLRHVDNAVELLVEDFGSGFDQGNRSGGGIGLVSIQERARLAGGTARIWSALGQGTTVRARIVLENS